MLLPRLSTVAAALIALAVPASSRSEFQNLKVVDNFSKHFLFPNSLEQTRAINSTLFSEDVRGTVDATTNFDGRELNTEYMFGLFSRLNVTGPSFLGTPINYTVSGIMAQNDNVVASVVFDFHYPYLDEIYPLELVTFFTINDNDEISEYSTTFRRWSWGSDVILPKQIPLMAKWMNITKYDNDTEVLQTYMAHQTCVGAMDHCHGENEQYKDYKHCMSFLRTIPVGEMYRLGDHNLACRFLHVGMLKERPQIHCPHVGPSGGDMCIARDYNDVVRMDHFTHGFIAPAVITPENEKLIDGTAMTASSQMPSLLEISMSLKNIHSWDPTAFAANAFWLMGIIWLTTKLIDYLFCKLNTRFDSTDAYQRCNVMEQRNIVMYCVNIIFITVGFILLVAIIPPALSGEHHLWQVQLMRFVALLICSLYMFELVFRWELAPILVAHRLLTIFVTAFAYASFEYCLSPVYLVSLVIWLVQVTTDQVMYAAMLGDSLHWEPKMVAKLYKIAAVQCGVVDILSIIGLVTYWAFAQNYYYRTINVLWTITVWVSAVAVLVGQTIASRMLWRLGQEHQGISLSDNSPLLAAGSPRASDEA